MLFPRRRERTLALVLAAAAAAVLCAAFLFGSPPDEEEFRFAVLSASLRIQALAGGHSTLWTALLGLGIPQPLVPNFVQHPLAPLLASMSPVTWVRVLLMAHTLVGTVGMWRLGSACGWQPVVRATGVVTFLFAAPVQNYVLFDFWPSHFIVWTLAPWMLLFAWNLLSTDAVDVRRSSCLLGVTSGIAAANANPAYLLVFVPLAAAVLLAHTGGVRARWPWLALSAALAGTIAAPTFVQLVSERQYFAAGLALSNVTDPLALPAAAANAFAPMTADPLDTRSLFFGAPYFVLALVGCVWLGRARADLSSSMVIYAVLLFTAWIPIPWISQRYQFRDPLTLCAILLAGLALHEALKHARLRPLAAILLVLQTGSVAYVAAPVLQRMVDAEGRRAVAFRGATGATPLVEGVLELLQQPGRLAYSPQVDYDVSERALVVDGLGINALAYRGAAVMNGSFKSVSTDPISPDDRLFYGRIRTPAAFMRSAAGFDVLGIRYLLARRDEAVPDDFREIGSYPTSRGGALVVYENADAWPGAFLVPPTPGDEDLPRLPECPHDRLLCRDLSPVAAQGDATTVKIERGDDDVVVRFTASAEPRILVLSEMFRPAWAATSGGRSLATRPMYGALLAVPLPPHVAEVRLQYQASALALAMWASVVVMVGGGLAAVPRSMFRVPRSCAWFGF